MPPASRSLRLLAFAVPASLAVAAVQPLVAALVAPGGWEWALSLASPAMLAAGACLACARLTDRPGEPGPAAAWLLLPGAFLLAGAAAMCLIGAIVPVRVARDAEWILLAAGSAAWLPALWWVRSHARPADIHIG